MAVDPSKLKLSKQHGRKDILFSVVREASSSRVFMGSSDFRVYHIDPMSDKPESVAWEGHQSYVTSVKFAGPQLVSSSYDRNLIWWDVETGKQVRSVRAHDKWIRQIKVSPNGNVITSVADDMVCRLWDARSGKMLRELKGHEPRTPNLFPSMLFCCAISPDGKRLATADKVGHVVVWELDSGKQITTLEAPELYTWDPQARIHSIGGVRSLAFSPDNRLLAVGGMGKVGNIDHLGGVARIEVFDWQKGEKTHELRDDKTKGLVEDLHFHPNGEWLFAAGGDNSGFLHVYDLPAKKLVKEEKAPMHVHELAVNEDYTTIVAAGHGKLAIWEAKA